MKLNQVIATEKGIKSRTHSELTKLHHKTQRVDLYNGFSKSYMPKDDEGDRFPNEEKIVQDVVESDLQTLSEIMTELFDVTATKDFGNCYAHADLIVDGKLIFEKIPSTYLIFLEKQLIQIKTFIEKLPELDPSDDWKPKDVNTGLYKVEPYETHKTKKTAKPITLSKATPEHPAQVQLITEDVVVGYWNMVKFSGAMPATKKKNILNKINKLSDAVKVAREQSNCINVEQINIGNKIFDYLFA